MKKENLLLTSLITLVFVMGFFIGKNYNNDSGRYFFKEYDSYYGYRNIKYLVYDTKEGYMYLRDINDKNKSDLNKNEKKQIKDIKNKDLSL